MRTCPSCNKKTIHFWKLWFSKTHCVSCEKPIDTNLIISLLYTLSGIAICILLLKYFGSNFKVPIIMLAIFLGAIRELVVPLKVK